MGFVPFKRWDYGVSHSEVFLMLTTANSCRLHRTPSILTPTLSTSQFPDKSSSDLQFYGLCHGLPLKTRVAKAIRYGRLNKPAAVSWITEKGSDYVQGGTCWPAAGRCRSVIPEKSSAGWRRRANEAVCAPRQCLLNYPQLLRPGCQCWPLRWKRKGSQWLSPPALSKYNLPIIWRGM